MTDIHRHSAFRFHHPDFDKGEDDHGFTLGPVGEFELIDDSASIRQAILMILSTNPGERVMRPEYGCDRRRLISSPNDDTTAGLAAHYVRRAITHWEPRVEILSVDANQDREETEKLRIDLQYRTRHCKEVHALRYTLNLAGGHDR